MVSGLSFSLNQERLKSIFEEYGPISHIKLPYEKDEEGNQQLKGYGFIEFKDEESVEESIEGQDKTEIKGRMIRVERFINDKKKIQENKEKNVEREINKLKRKRQYLEEEEEEEEKDSKIFKFDKNKKFEKNTNKFEKNTKKYEKNKFEKEEKEINKYEKEEKRTNIKNNPKYQKEESNTEYKGFKIKNKTENTIKNNIENYSIKIKNLPKDTTEMELKQKFKKYNIKSIKITNSEGHLQFNDIESLKKSFEFNNTKYKGNDLIISRN
jgi:RNA recognition motif-containing protein